ncbi:MAG: TolC family protein [Candidatus Delongbacteria bacterium]|nr:TolC family protein [Candidatus Delongbacteria bacterium]
MKRMLLLFLIFKILQGAPMTLQDCIRTAESNNVDVKIADQGRVISEYSLKDARNRFFDITGSGSYFVNGDDNDNLTSDLNASAGLTARLSSSLITNYRSSGISLNSSGLDYENTLSNVRFTVINSFFQVLIAEERLKLQKEIAEYSRKKYEESELRFSMGNISRSDLLNFEVSMSSDIIDLKSAESDLRKSRQNLIYYMRADIEPDSLELIYESSELSEDDYKFQDLIDEALENRYDVSMQKNSTLQRELSLRMEYENYLPSLSGSVSYDYRDHKDLNDDLFSHSSDGITVGIGLSLNITYSGLNSIDRSKAELKRSRLQLDNKIESVKNELKLKLLELENQKNNYILAEKHVELAQENLDLADKLFFIGDKSATDYLQARNSYVSAEYRKISAYYNLILSKYDLLNSLGRKF